ncbi:hypothetical protein DYH09_30075 [bacterium CPR1]|nr:hypothetical protein [bacterium CPR1]
MIVLLLIVFLVGCAKPEPTEDELTEQTMRDIAQSHIEGNMPAEKDFAIFLQRDLAKYFSQRVGKQVNVDYEMLRDGPTQTGIGYPKFFAWLKIRDGDKILEEGAVVLSAVDRKEFSVQDYHDVNSIKQAPQSVRDSFPPAVAEAILSKIESRAENRLCPQETWSVGASPRGEPLLLITS